VRQPQVGGRRLLAAAHLVLAAALAAPVVLAAHTLGSAGAFLVEFLTGDRVPALSALVPPASRRPLALAAVAADRHARPAFWAGPPLVLVPGFTPDGKDDPRALRAARLLAEAGFTVTVPTVPGLTRGRLRPDDVAPVVRAIAAADDDGARPVTVIGVSVGAGPALLAAADARVRDRVGAVVSLGGYASATELLRFFLTGDYAFGEARGRVEHDPAVVGAFVEANADLLDPATARALTGGDRAALAAALDRLSPEVTALLAALSPERVAGDLRARLVLVHARGDRAVPYTESLRLAAARPRDTRVVLVDLLDHVEGAGGTRWSGLGQALTLWGVLYGLLRGA
jgi:pimeloyl-ACP methyl ester carboxylesterase